jgi:secondary thiamine-phosphate synthase enzyme
VKEGLALVNAMHITASVFINDDEPGLHQDYDEWLEKLAPHDPTSKYRHNRTGEDNGDAHLKRQIMGREVVVAVTNGKLDFGPWEQIFYGEFDGRRKKRVLVKIFIRGVTGFHPSPRCSGAFLLDPELRLKARRPKSLPSGFVLFFFSQVKVRLTILFHGRSWRSAGA